MGKINGVERGRSKVELAGRTDRMGLNGVELMGSNGVKLVGRMGRMGSNGVEWGRIMVERVEWGRTGSN